MLQYPCEFLVVFFFPYKTDDHSRVYLEDTGQPGSDYINANFIDVSC